MIQFPCTCGFQFEVPDELSSTSLQCPQCGLLVNVPALDELAHLESDGTIRLEPESVQEKANRDAELMRVYRPQRQDDNGNDYDLRPTFEDILKAGVDEVPLELKDQVRPGPPKYDPVTGELIRPMAIKGDEYPHVLPLPVQPNRTLNYARPNVQMSDAVPFWSVPLALLRPVNLIVLFAVLVAHFLNAIIWIPLGGGFFFLAPVVIVVQILIVSHFGVVTEEMGPGGRDELHTPLRYLEFGDDIWNPLVHFCGSLLICYGLALLSLVFVGPRALWPMAVPLMVAGTFFFPAVFLTLSTSGTPLNLRADRVMEVIGKCGVRYFVVIGLWALAFGTYGIGLWETTRYSILLVNKNARAGVLLAPLASYLLLTVGIYGMHLFTWWIGSLYRDHHDQFPWILQAYISDKPALQRRVPRRKVSYLQTPAPQPAAPAAITPPPKATPIQPMRS